MNSSPLTRHRIFWDAAIIISTIIAIGSTIYSLTHGIYEVYPFLYFLPLILFVNFYPERGVLFSLALSTIRPRRGFPILILSAPGSIP